MKRQSVVSSTVEAEAAAAEATARDTHHADRFTNATVADGLVSIVEDERAKSRAQCLAEIHSNLSSEMESVELRLMVLDDEITAMLEDFSISFEKVIYKRNERAQLAALLEGLKYAAERIPSPAR